MVEIFFIIVITDCFLSSLFISFVAVSVSFFQTASNNGCLFHIFELSSNNFLIFILLPYSQKRLIKINFPISPFSIRIYSPLISSCTADQIILNPRRIHLHIIFCTIPHSNINAAIPAVIAPETLVPDLLP